MNAILLQAFSSKEQAGENSSRNGGIGREWSEKETSSSQNAMIDRNFSGYLQCFGNCAVAKGTLRTGDPTGLFRTQNRVSRRSHFSLRDQVPFVGPPVDHPGPGLFQRPARRRRSQRDRGPEVWENQGSSGPMDRIEWLFYRSPGQ